MRSRTPDRARIQRSVLLALPLAVVLSACGSAGSPSASIGSTASANAVDSRQGGIPGGRITGAEFSGSIDRSGRATHPQDAFEAATDRAVYVVIRLADAPPASKISYVRSLNGKFVDARSIFTRPKTSLVYFQWSAESGHTLTPGRYLVRVYLNGERAWEGRYTVS